MLIIYARHEDDFDDSISRLEMVAGGDTITAMLVNIPQNKFSKLRETIFHLSKEEALEMANNIHEYYKSPQS